MNDINLETIEQISNEKIKVALKLILKEMNYKDEIILKLKRENEALKKAIEELKNEKQNDKISESKLQSNISSNKSSPINPLENHVKIYTKSNTTEINSISNKANKVNLTNKVKLVNSAIIFNNEINTNYENKDEKIDKKALRMSQKPERTYISKLDEISHKRQNSTNNEYRPIMSEPNKSSNMNIDKRNEIKKFLEKAKSRLPNESFKEFLISIKELTSNGTENKKISRTQKVEVLEKVKNIFGEELKDLFQKFEELIIKKDKYN